MSAQPGRSIGRKLGFALVAALLVLLLAEGGLRAVAWATDRDWRSSPLPVHEPYPVVCTMGEDFLKLCEEHRHGYARVRPEMFLREPDQPRVVIIGESFVYGLGIEIDEAVPAQLEERLGGGVEVLNWGRCGTYAGVLTTAVEAAVELRPDLLVLAIGNNEHTMTSFYTGWPARHPVAFHALAGSLGRLQLFGLLSRAVAGGLPQPSERFERDVVIEDPVERAAYSARRRPPDLSHFEDELAEPAVTRIIEREQRLKERIYRAHLERMVGLAQDAGVAVVLATLPSRLGSPPVLSGIHDGDPGTLRGILQQLQQGAGEATDRLVRDGLAEDPRVAAFQYARAQQLLASGDRAGALEAFHAQAEWDLVPDGTPALNEVVRAVAAERGCGLVELEPLSAQSLDPGEPMFLDRVHVSAAGAVVVAATMEPVVRAELGL